MIAHNPALLIQVAHYPRGGIHGGHIAVVWNQNGNGYVVSLHFTERRSAPTHAREAEVGSIASSMSQAGSRP